MKTHMFDGIWKKNICFAHLTQFILYFTCSFENVSKSGLPISCLHIQKNDWPIKRMTRETQKAMFRFVIGFFRLSLNKCHPRSLANTWESTPKNNLSYPCLAYSYQRMHFIGSCLKNRKEKTCSWIRCSELYKHRQHLHEILNKLQQGN